MQAATLACGAKAFISHGSAAALLELTQKSLALIHLIGPGERGRGIDGIRWHRVPLPGSTEVTTRHGIPCTTVPRTLVDLAGTVGASTLVGLIEEAAVQRSLDVRKIDRILARRRRRGAPTLRDLIAPWRVAANDLPTLRSRLEARVWPQLVKRGLPLPRSNVEINLDGIKIEVDFLWDVDLLVVETDGAETHATRQAFDRDRWRDQPFVAAGYRVIRVTWKQMAEEPEAVLARVARILGP
jgi:very-short-patch-repair endonuclease